MIGMEQRFAVGQFRVIQQNRIYQITNGSFRSTSHFRRDVSQCVQIIVDNRLAGN